MEKLIISIIVTFTFALCSTRSRYVATPIKDIRFPEMNEGIKRLPGKVPRPVHYLKVPESIGTSQLPESRQERLSSDVHHPYVDYGAHTGHHGAFGWYVDFPVQNKGS